MPNYARTHIADAVTAANTKVLGDSPATATGNLMIAASQFIATNMQNQANEQGQEEVMWQTATDQGINTLMNTGNTVEGE